MNILTTDVYNDSSLVVTTATQYMDFYELDENDFFNDDNKAYNLICDIISLQIAYYLMRRTVGVFGDNVENIESMISNKKAEYKKVAGKDYQDPNEDVDW